MVPDIGSARTVPGAGLGAETVREFTEPGRSATDIAHRPAFQEMMAWIKANRDEVDFLVVYQFNRIFRNTIDAAITKRELSKYSVRIVSAVMDLGDGPESAMVEMILHAVDEDSLHRRRSGYSLQDGCQGAVTVGLSGGHGWATSTPATCQRAATSVSSPLTRSEPRSFGLPSSSTPPVTTVLSRSKWS